MKETAVRILCGILGIVTAAGVAVAVPEDVQAKSETILYTGIKEEVIAEGRYSNWEGVSNVSGFSDNKKNYCFAIDGKKYITVVKTKNGKKKATIKLKKRAPVFGAVTCDSKGNYYVVSGKANTNNNTSKKTVFVSKYNKKGKLLKTVGDNGSSSLDYYYDNSFYTKTPFEAGNCDVAVNGDYLMVNYAREMYSGHQSNSVLTIKMSSMKKVKGIISYNSHSFAQRVIPYEDGFLWASEGDCFNRAFTVSGADLFHFWVKEGTYDNWDMFTLNNNYAHLGGIAAADKTHVALSGTSVKALSSKAEKQNEQLFIQIFDPTKDVSKASAYYTSGKRKGYSGPNGDENVTDYGVKWLTGAGVTVENPQIVSDSKGNFIVLYEKYAKSGNYAGVYYMVLNKKGKILRKETRYSAKALLNPCEMPVCIGQTVYWTSNKYSDSSYKLYVCKLKIKGL